MAEAAFEILHKEMDEIKSNVEKIILILENEGEVRESVLEQLEEARNAPKEKFIPHEKVKKALVK